MRSAVVTVRVKFMTGSAARDTRDQAVTIFQSPEARIVDVYVARWVIHLPD